MFQPLQIPGAIELFAVLMVFVLSLILVVGASYWVYTDAKERGNDAAALWTAVTAVGFLLGLFPGIAVLVVYFLVGRD